jgi:hypothetical protein
MVFLVNKNDSLLQVSEFEAYTKKVLKATGSDSVRFFTTIRDMLNYFWEADQNIKNTPMSFGEFESTAQRIAGLLGKEEASRFFKAMHGALPLKTIQYMGVMVKFFELAENYEIP